MKAVKIVISGLAGFLMCVSTWAEAIQISATKKTDDQRKTSSQQLAHGSTQLSLKNVYYRFDIRPMTTGLPEEAELQYIVLQENVNGKVEVAVRGTQSVSLTFGQPQSIESESFELTKRSWNRAGGSGNLKQDVYGYGVRIVNRDGDVLAEKYAPSSTQKDLEAAFLKTPGQDRRAAEKNLMEERMKMKRKHRPFSR